MTSLEVEAIDKRIWRRFETMGEPLRLRKKLWSVDNPFELFKKLKRQKRTP